MLNLFCINLVGRVYIYLCEQTQFHRIQQGKDKSPRMKKILATEFFFSSNKMKFFSYTKQDYRLKRSDSSKYIDGLCFKPSRRDTTLGINNAEPSSFEKKKLKWLKKIKLQQVDKLTLEDNTFQEFDEEIKEKKIGENGKNLDMGIIGTVVED